MMNSVPPNTLLEWKPVLRDILESCKSLHVESTLKKQFSDFEAAVNQGHLLNVSKCAADIWETVRRNKLLVCQSTKGWLNKMAHIERMVAGGGDVKVTGQHHQQDTTTPVQKSPTPPRASHQSTNKNAGGRSKLSSSIEVVIAAEQRYLSARKKAEEVCKENERQKREIEKFMRRAEVKTSDAVDGAGISMLASAAAGDHIEKLQEAEKKVELEAAQKKAAIEERLKFEEEAKVANMKLEEAKTQTEHAKKKIEDELKAAIKHLEKERSQRLKAEDDCEKFRREKDLAEAMLAHTKKELNIAKKESHIPRSPTRAPSEEWKAKIDATQSEFEKERLQRIEKEKDLDRLQKGIGSMSLSESLKAGHDEYVDPECTSCVELKRRLLKYEGGASLSESLKAGHDEYVETECTSCDEAKGRISDLKQMLLSSTSEVEVLTCTNAKMAKQIQEHEDEISDLKDTITRLSVEQTKMSKQVRK